MAFNPFDPSILPGGLLRPLKSKLLKKESGGYLSCPFEHLSKNPCGKWRLERDLQRAALKEKVYLQNKVEKLTKKNKVEKVTKKNKVEKVTKKNKAEKVTKKSKCGWWGRRGAKKRREQEVAEESQLQECQPPKKKTKQGSNYGRKSNGDLGRANPFPTLDLSAKVIQ